MIEQVLTIHADWCLTEHHPRDVCNCGAKVEVVLHPFLRKYIYLKYHEKLSTYYAAKIAQWTVYADNVASHHAGIHIDSQLRAYEKMQD